MESDEKMGEKLSKKKQELKRLRQEGKTASLASMNKEAFVAHSRALKDFSDEFEEVYSNRAEQEILKKFGKNKQEILVILALLQSRVGDEEYNRSFRGRLGIKKSLTKEEKAARKKEAEAEKAIELVKIRKMLEEVDVEVEKIRAKRVKEANFRYGTNETASHSRGILTDAVDEFRNALVSPLLDSDVIELQRKRDGLEALEAVREIHEARGENVAGIAEKAKRVIAGTATVVGKFAEETTGGVLKAVTLFLGWPIVLPVKLLNTAFAGAKYAFCFVDGVFGFFDKGLDGLFPNLDRKADGTIKVSAANALKGIPHVLIRGPILLVRGVCQGAAIGFRFLEKHIDADRWLKKAPVTSGFVLGGVGTILLIGIVVASVFTLGIPIAALAGGLIAASIGAAIYGYFKGKAKKDELVSLKLSSSESSQLEKYEHAHQHRIEQAPSLQTTAEPKEDEKSGHDLSTEHIEAVTESLVQSSKKSALHGTESSAKFVPLHKHKDEQAQEPQHSQDPKKPSGKLKQD